VLLLLAPLVWPAPAPDAEPPLSVVQVPLELDLAPLSQAADALLPRSAGAWPRWVDRHGIEVRYRAWRGPLRLEMAGGLLRASAHVRYQLQARKGLLGQLALRAGCGVEEPPRQAVVGLLARLDWGADWVPRPR
jgi:hypothetical protein